MYKLDISTSSLLLHCQKLINLSSMGTVEKVTATINKEPPEQSATGETSLHSVHSQAQTKTFFIKQTSAINITGTKYALTKINYCHNHLSMSQNGCMDK